MSAASGNGTLQAISVGLLTGQELPQAGAMLARAFRDNPLNRAVLEGRARSARLRANAHGMRAHLPVALSHGQLLAARLDGHVAGVLVSAPPGAHPFPPPPLAARLRCWLGQGFRVASRWGQVYQELQVHHPREAHWYLGTLGVDPPVWSRGVATALLERWLPEAERSGVPIWLETDQLRTHALYERFGFRVVNEIPVLGVPVWLLRREVGSVSDSASPGSG